ncbi:MAG: 50S ribosomal protein L13 [Candidatus Lokiarchaeota archaeon]|nr:50S ribosomal protein L13 [Candidatus Lokiarchaeota archaeon]
MTEKTIIMDGTNLILGRICSIIAKKLLNGEKITLINAENIVISGNKKMVLKDYIRRTQIKTRTAPWRGPFQPRRPDKLVKRTVRGMLPRNNDRGFKALKNLKVIIGEPNEFKDKERENLSSLFPKIGLNKISGKFITIGELSKEIGWNPAI